MSKKTLGMGLALLVSLAFAPAMNAKTAAKPNAKALVSRQLSRVTPQWAGPLAAPRSPAIGPGVIYTNTTSSGYFFSAQGPGTVAYDDVPLNTLTDSLVAVSKITVGVVQKDTAPATTVNIYWATTAVASPYINMPGTLACSIPIGGNTSGATILTLASCGDGVTPISGMEAVPLDQTFDPGIGGFFAIGVGFPDAAGLNLNGWQLTTGPDFNEDLFWAYDGSVATFSWFGGTIAATFYLEVEGVTTTPVTLQGFHVD